MLSTECCIQNAQGGRVWAGAREGRDPNTYKKEVKYYIN